MIDMHCHVLPGVNDGAQSMRKGLNTRKLMKANVFVVISASRYVR